MTSALWRKLRSYHVTLVHEPAAPAAVPPPDTTAKDRAKADQAADRELVKLYYETVLEVAKDTRARSLEGAKHVQVAAGAIGTLYTGALALVFSQDGDPLPVRGLLTPLFLAAAISLSTFYLGFVQQPQGPLRRPKAVAGLPETQLLRANHLVRWIGQTTQRRSWAMRSAIFALGAGMAFLPAPFVSGQPATPARAAPPAIPEAIADPVAAKAAEVFVRQADAYLAPSASTFVDVNCDRGWPELVRSCGWRGAADVNDRFRELGLAAGLLVFLPGLIALLEWGLHVARPRRQQERPGAE